VSGKQIPIKSKLLKLREWLTVPEAARHLSILFSEEVSEADVLRLSMDGHLKLSVNFVNHARANCGRIVTEKEIVWEEMEVTPSLEKFFKGSVVERTISTNADGEKIHRYVKSTSIDGKRFINFDDKVTTIRGVWDLSMLGNEAWDVEHRYQMLTDGPEVTLINLEGAFVERDRDMICKLLESMDNNEYQKGSMAQLEAIKEYIASKNIDKAKADEMLAKHKQDREEYLKKRESQDESADYYPAGGLPKDSVLVVRTRALIDLHKRLSSEASENEGAFGSDVETTFLSNKHPFHARELKIAVEAWNELYEKNPPQHVPQGGHKKYITDWLAENHPSLGQRALERISTIVNPNPKGGASPTGNNY